MNCKIIPSITTHSQFGSTWRDKIEELRTLPIVSIGLFVTGLTEEERIECYQRLLEVKREKSFTIPFVHAVSSMCEDEYEFLTRNFGTEKFNLHPVREFPLEHPLSPKLRARISIENSSSHEALFDEDVDGFSGVCVDLSHYESLRRKDPISAGKLADLATRRGVEANHLSGIQELPEITRSGLLEFSNHHLNAECTIHYLTQLLPSLIAPLCALEVENSLVEQLDAIAILQQFIAEGHQPLAA